MADTRERRTKSSSAAGSSKDRSVRGAEDAARSACRTLTGLIDHPSEGVSAVSRTDDGWVVNVDVLEVARIPDTTSLLATYEVELDNEGGLVSYRRISRYRRGSADS
ncbi:gas vesicle protein [Streptomyces sp. NPDC006475]|uniref:Gas vesicle protein n=1 Tax=Streptomyces achmelvichensis TaxID=3134111 RepID=A0ACC6PNS1_9ACTN|nr:gas vesicle protein [Streptomyces sp. NBC_01167]